MTFQPSNLAVDRDMVVRPDLQRNAAVEEDLGPATDNDKSLCPVVVDFEGVAGASNFDQEAAFLLIEEVAGFIE